MNIRLICTLATVLTALASGGCRRQAMQNTVTVGSKNFTEQLIISELMAQIIEADTGLKVKRMFNLGGTMICHEGLVSGELDLYAEYTGTALTAILKQPAVTDPEKAYNIVSGEYSNRFGCAWLKPFGFNNTYAITARSDVADKNGWKNISDLRESSGNVTAGFTAEFMEREDGYPGLRMEYSLEFSETRDMEPSLMYQAVAQQNVDIICGFATDGRIAAYDLVMLEDDRGFFPPYYAAPVVRCDS